MRLLKFALAGLLVYLTAACAGLEVPKVNSTRDGLALAEISLTNIALEVKTLKDQGVLVRDAAAATDMALTQASNALDGAWIALGKGDEATAVSLLKVAQGINAQLLLILQQQKGQPNGKPRGLRERSSDRPVGGYGPGRDRHALQHDEGTGPVAGSNLVYGRGTGSDPRRAESGGGRGAGWCLDRTLAVA